VSPRVAFVSARSAFVDGAIHTDAGLGRLIDQLALRFEGLRVGLSARPARAGFQDHTLSVPPERFVPLPWMESVARGFRQAPACRRAIARLEAEADVLVVQLPFAAVFGLYGATRPRVYHVCGDVETAVTDTPSYRGARRVVAFAAAELIHHAQQDLATRPGTRIVTHGRALLAKLSGARGRAVVSSGLFSREIQSVERSRPPGAPFRVLFVGFLRPEKGFDVLLAAFERLLAEVPDAELMVVGGAGAVDRVSGPLRAALDRLGPRATLAGHAEFGPALFRHYADADVLALASYSEGTPRVLVEARAFGCPVVATAVGGIPTSVEDGVDGVLVPPGDAAAMARALVRVAKDRAFRQGLVERGLARARRTTVEAFAGEIADEVERLWEETR